MIEKVYRVLLDPIDRRSVRYRFLIYVHDVGWAFASFPIAIWLRDQIEFSTNDAGFLLGRSVAFTAIAIVAFWLTGVHRGFWRHADHRDIQTMALATVVAVTIFVVALFLFDRMDGVARSVPLIQGLVLIFGLTGGRLLYAHARRKIARRSAAEGEQGVLHVLIFGTDELAKVVLSFLDCAPQPVRVAGIIASSADTRGKELGGVSVIGSLGTLQQTIAELQVRGIRPTRIINTVLGQTADAAARGDLLERAARQVGLEIQDALDFVRESTQSLHGREAGQPRAGDIERPALSAEALAGAARHALDMALAMAALVVTAPLLLSAMVLTWLQLGNPVILAQWRTGLRGRPFRVFKLRTMRNGIDADGRLLGDAERVTRLGRLLRCTRIDEFLQFVNILIGDMALIGPRPLLAEQIESVPHELLQERTLVRPGITGWAQVNGGNHLSVDQKIAMDIWYVRNRTLTVDFLICWKTIRMCFVGERIDARALEESRTLLVEV